jgi:hypothetical protein
MSHPPDDTPDFEDAFIWIVCAILYLIFIMES